MTDDDAPRAVQAAAIQLLWKSGRNAKLAVERAEVIYASRPPDSESRKRWEKVVELLIVARDTGQIPLAPQPLARA